MKRVILIVMLVAAAFALPAKAQMNNNQPAYGTAPVAPTVTFQSTGSAMMSSGSAYSANPTIGADGTAAYEAPKAAVKPRPGEGTIHTFHPTTSNNQPLGDALWPLMVLACAYLIMRVYRKRRV